MVLGLYSIDKATRTMIRAGQQVVMLGVIVRHLWPSGKQQAGGITHRFVDLDLENSVP